MHASLTSYAFYFGTFNPVHFGHLAIAQAAYRQLGFQKVIFIPAGVSPFKQNLPDMASSHDRLAMLGNSLTDYPYFTIDPIELERPDVSYSIITLDQLRERYAIPAEHKIPFIIGTDALAHLDQWYEYERLIEQVVFIQAPRDGSPLRTRLHNGTPIQTIPIEMPMDTRQSSMIRQQFNTGAPIEGDVPPAVVHYLNEHPLIWKQPAIPAASHPPTR